MEYETAGDPMTDLKWTRKTCGKVAEELKSLRIQVSENTVARLLKQMDFSLRINKKCLSSASSTNRDEQFVYIAELREWFVQESNPIVSVDTKKKEKIGPFKNQGTVWGQESSKVNDYDYPSLAEGKGIPYGIYDWLANCGSVFVGTSYDTPEFAVECIVKWWRYDGCKKYPGIKHLLILADGGGSNGNNCNTWKYWLQHKLCNPHDISVTVSHYPPGCSKWNPIEHRLFSEISKNWAGRPLDSYETLLNYIRTTKTSTGLKVKAYLVRKKYTKGIKVSDDQMSQLRIVKHETLGNFNYTLNSSKNGN